MNETHRICSNSTKICRVVDALLPFTVDLMNATIGNEFDECDPSNLTTFNCTKQQYLMYQRGDNVSSLAIPVTIVYTVILLAGLFGNVCVCIVIAQNQSLHTNTNYYLFNLAVADLLYLLFGLPFEIHMFWHQYPWPLGSAFCKLRELMSEACSYASVLTIVAFSIERYIAICYPLYSYVMSTLKRVITVVAIIWIISFVSAIPIGYYRQVKFVRYPPDGPELPESAICTISNEFKGIYEASTIVFFLIPLLVLIVMYARIASKLRQCIANRINGRLGKFSVNANTKQLMSRRNIVRMLIIIVIMFFISWAPFHAQRLVFVYGKQWSHYFVINEYLFTIGGFFYYLSCTINPIIYNVMSHRYRLAFHQTFCWRRNAKASRTEMCNKP